MPRLSERAVTVSHFALHIFRKLMGSTESDKKAYVPFKLSYRTPTKHLMSLVADSGVVAGWMECFRRVSHICMRVQSWLLHVWAAIELFIRAHIWRADCLR